MLSSAAGGRAKREINRIRETVLSTRASSGIARLKQVAHQRVPVIQTHFKHFRFVHVRNVQQILQTVQQAALQLGRGFQQLHVRFEKLREENGQVLNERLFTVRSVRVGFRNVRVPRQRRRQMVHQLGIHRHELPVVLRVHEQTPNLCQTLQHHVPIRRVRKQPQQCFQQRTLKDVPEWNPRQKRVQRHQRLRNQLRFLRIRQHKLAQLVNHRKLRVQTRLQTLNLILRHFPSREIKHFLR